jgi:hypothetical protein
MITDVRRLFALAFASAEPTSVAPGPDTERDMSAKAQQTLKAEVEDKLDQALRDSFPASDPVSFIEPGPVKDSDRKLPARGKAGRKAKGKATRF